MKALLTLALFGISALAAPVPKEVKKLTPLDQLQGKWVLVSLDSGSGQQVQTGDLATLTLTIAGDKFSAVTTCGAGYKNVALEFDLSAKPMRMDIKEGMTVSAGITKFEDGELHWCSAHPDKPAPTEFRGVDGCACYIWKRAEK